jgi:hypothetical protein
MDTGDNLVPKWAFLILLLIFLLFGEAPAGDSNGLDSSIATTPMVDHDLPTTLLTDNPKNSLEAK